MCSRRDKHRRVSCVCVVCAVSVCGYRGTTTSLVIFWVLPVEDTACLVARDRIKIALLATSMEIAYDLSSRTKLIEDAITRNQISNGFLENVICVHFICFPLSGMH